MRYAGKGYDGVLRVTTGINYIEAATVLKTEPKWDSEGYEISKRQVDRT